MADQTFNFNLSTGGLPTGAIGAQGTELSNTQDPTQLSPELKQNIGSSISAVGNNVADNSKYLGDAETFRKGVGMTQAALATGLNILNFQESLNQSVNGYDTLNQIVSAGTTVATVGGIAIGAAIGSTVIPVIGTVIGAAVGLFVSPYLQQESRIFNANKEAKYIALTQGPIINKR